MSDALKEKVSTADGLQEILQDIVNAMYVLINLLKEVFGKIGVKYKFESMYADDEATEEE